MEKLIKSENFFVGFDNLKNCDYKRGRIYLNGNHFANFYTLDKSWGEAVISRGGINKTGWIAFNRDALALEMNCPVIEQCESFEKLLEILENFIVNFKKEHLK
jgi:hypothetical protein